VEIDGARRGEVVGRNGLEQSFSGVREALGGALAWDAAVVATPARLHVPLALQLAEAGIHLLIEKPLSVHLAGVEQLCDVVRDKRLVAAVGYSWRAHPVVAGMRQRLAEMDLGEPLELIVVSGQHFPTYRPAYREIFYRDRTSGGGAIQDALTHMLNVGQWLAGPIDRVLADCDHLALEGVAVEDTVHVLTRQGGVMGCYALNQHQTPNEASWTVVCRHGTIRGEAHTSRVLTMKSPEAPWHEQHLPPADRDIPFIAQAQAFLDATEGKRPPLCTLEEGVQTLKVNLAVLEACSKPSAWVSAR
jgi:predicted dehydrogenase